MTSPPEQHDPRDNRPGREDAGDHPPLGQVEAGPKRHSDDPFVTMARDIIHSARIAIGYYDPYHTEAKRLAAIFATTLRAVDRAAREECAQMAEATFRGVNIAARIRSTIKS